MTMKRSELGIFDIDGTIRDEKGIPPEVLNGFRRLYEHHVITTILTGRGYGRMREILGPYYSTIVRRNSPIGLENGSRISRKGGQNIIHHRLHPSEIKAVLDTTLIGDVEFVAYFPEQPRRKAVFWTPNSATIASLHLKYGHFAQVHHLTPELFERQAIEDRPGMFVIKPSAEGWEELLSSGINRTTNEGLINVNPKGINKGSGLTEIRGLLGIDPEKILFAGNDHNDLPAFSNNTLGTNLLVGGKLSGLLTVPYTHIDSVPELGKYLQKYNRI